MSQRIVSTLLLLICTSAFTLAQPRTPMPPREMDAPHEAILKKLNLTEAQEIQMKKLRIDMMKKQIQLHAKIQTLRLDSKELFLADKIDRKAIETNIKSIDDLQEQLKLNMVDFWFGVNSNLTPDQQKIWKRHAMEMGDNMQDGMKRRNRERFRERFEDGDEIHRNFE